MVSKRTRNQAHSLDTAWNVLKKIISFIPHRTFTGSHVIRIEQLLGDFLSHSHSLLDRAVYTLPVALSNHCKGLSTLHGDRISLILPA